MRILLRIRYVTLPDGTTPFGGDDPVGKISAILEGVNLIYRPVGIAFALHPDGITPWESEAYFRVAQSTDLPDVHWHARQGWINVYYLQRVGGANGIAFSPGQFSDTRGWAVAMGTHQLLSGTSPVEEGASPAGGTAAGLAHELGHCLGLHHTFATFVAEASESATASIRTLLRFVMSPFADDTEGLSDEDEARNVMSYSWRNDPGSISEFAWTAAQIRKMRLTLASGRSQVAFVSSASVPLLAELWMYQALYRPVPMDDFQGREAASLA